MKKAVFVPLLTLLALLFAGGQLALGRLRPSSAPVLAEGALSGRVSLQKQNLKPFLYQS